MTASLLIALYALLLVVGGTVGWLKAGSVASLLVSGFFALGLLSSYYCPPLRSQRHWLTSALLLLLLAFFGMRWWVTAHLFPAGIMMGVTALTVALLWFLEPSLRFSSLCCCRSRCKKG